MDEKIRSFISGEKNLAEAFLSGLKGTDRIILCGGGYALYWYCKYFAWKNVKPDYIMDKNYGQSKEKFGIPVVSKEFLLNHIDPGQCKFVITAPKYRDEIIREIRQEFGDVEIHAFEAEIYYTFIRDIGEYRQYLLQHYEELVALYGELEDPESKKTLVSFIKGRISGDQKYFTDVLAPDQYFPGDILSLGSHEVIVEAGSNDGRTLLDMIRRTDGKFEKIYCFEPDEACIRLLEEIINNSHLPVTLVKKGVGDRAGRLYFKTDSKYGASHMTDHLDYDYVVDVTTLDEELSGKVSYIKMDIEGMELNCLKGAASVISKYAPKLAVCVYHKKEDIIEIQKYLKMLNPNYKFYLRHHNWGATETVLYAV